MQQASKDEPSLVLNDTVLVIISQMTQLLKNCKKK